MFHVEHFAVTVEFRIHPAGLRGPDCFTWNIPGYEFA